MKSLYVDNFRGFSRTYIPLDDVNFFVGENSTGKTSILSLIKILSDPKFWFSLDFELEEIDLGNFEDIVSQISDNKQNFSVGFSQKARSDKEKDLLFLITFKNRQDVPVVEYYSYVSESGMVHLKIGPKSIYYKLDNALVYEQNEQRRCQAFFEAAVMEHQSPSSRYKNFNKLKKTTFGGAPLGIKLQVVNSYLSKGDSPKNKSIEWPLGMIENVTWIAPIREKPKRTYDQYKAGYSPEGTHTPYLLNDFLGDRRGKHYRKSLQKSLERFGIDSELFKTIQVKRYGRHKTAPFEVDIVLNEEPLKISNVGYGVAQVLPIIVECFLREGKSSFAIQQPEVHLHPKAQASLGDYFHSLASEESKTFFIETHSDFLIDRFRRTQKKNKAVGAQVLFFERNSRGNTVHPICIQEDGKYGDDQPAGFRSFFVKEELEMLSL